MLTSMIIMIKYLLIFLNIEKAIMNYLLKVSNNWWWWQDSREGFVRR